MANMTVETALAHDGGGILGVTARIEVFDPEEKACVAELWDEFLHTGAEASGYHFLVYRAEGQIWGYACFGPRALTEGTYDLYWIATDPARRRHGVGQALLTAVEDAIRSCGGRLVIVETSGIEKYAPTRKFYLATGYTLEATLRDFYHPGDDLVIFTKRL
jgi:ribosomal protein S18 acetylase RimI-like enzyme